MYLTILLQLNISVEICCSFTKKYPATLWHSVKEGDLPQVDTDCLFSHDGKLIDMGYMREDRSLSFGPLIYIEDVDYWMEIPKLPTE